MKKYLVVAVCLLLVMFATPVFADLILVRESDNIGYMYDENDPTARYYIMDLDKFFTYIMYAVALRNEYDHFVYIANQYYNVGKYTYRYQIICGRGLVFIYFYRPVGDVWYEQITDLPAEDIKIIEEVITEYGLPEFPKD